MELVLYEVEVVGLLSYVILSINWVCYLENRASRCGENTKVCRHIILILHEVTVFIDAEVCCRELLTKDSEEVGEGLAQVDLEAVRACWVSLEIGVLQLRVLQEGKEHQDKTVGAKCALVGLVQALESQILLQNDGQGLQEGVLTDLLLHKVSTLLGRLRVSLLHVHLTRVWVLHLAGTQDIVEDQIDLKLSILIELCPAHIFLIENSVLLIPQFVEFQHIYGQLDHRDAGLLKQHV